MSPEPSFWPVHPIGGSLRPSSGRSSPDTQWGLTMRGPRGLLLLKERHTGRGQAGRPLLGWNCGHQHERQVCSQMSGRRVRVVLTRPSQLCPPSVRGTAGDSLS